MPPKKRLVQFNSVIDEEDDPYQPKQPKQEQQQQKSNQTPKDQQKLKNPAKSSPSGQKSLFDYMRKSANPKSHAVDLNEISIEEQLEIERQIQGQALGMQNLRLEDPMVEEIEEFRYTPPPRQQQQSQAPQQQPRDPFDTYKKEPPTFVRREVQFDVPIQVRLPNEPEQFKHRKTPYPKGLTKKGQSPPKDKLPETGLLKGLTIVLSGVFGVCNREKLEQLLKDHGAKVTGSISGKTSVLIVGDKLEDGRQGCQGNKFKEATRKGTRIVKEDDLDLWLQENLEKSLDELFDNNISKLYKKSISKLNQTVVHDKTIPLVDKYKPETLNELVGNKSSIASFYGWLERFDKPAEIEKRKKFIPMQMGQWQNVGGIDSKCCIISGPPGIGKSSMVRLVAQALDLEIISNNASDQRNKALVRDKLGVLVQNTVLNFYKKVNNKFIILMDEVDGMTGSDRGGIQALIEQIKVTRIPIVCICNDLEKTKLKSLLAYCYSIKFMNPEPEQVAKRLEYITKSEHLSYKIEDLQFIARQFNGDLRQSINFIDFTRASQSNANQFVKDKCSLINTFDAAKMLLSREGRKGLSYRDMQDLFFIDSDMIPLVVQDSYLQANCSDLKSITRAADLIADGDILSKAIRVRQQWGLMPGFALLSSVYPATLVGVEMAFPHFPTWYGKNSTARKVMRERHYIRNQLSTITYNCSCPDLMIMLFKVIITLLAKERIWEVTEILEAVRLTPENVKTELMDQVFNPQKLDFLQIVPPQVKANLTRTYNKRHFIAKEMKKGKNKIAAERNTSENYNPLMGEEAGVVEEVAEPIPSDEEEKQKQLKKPRKQSQKRATPKKAARKSKQKQESESDLSGFIASEDED